MVNKAYKCLDYLTLRMAAGMIRLIYDTNKIPSPPILPVHARVQQARAGKGENSGR